MLIAFEFYVDFIFHTLFREFWSVLLVINKLLLKIDLLLCHRQLNATLKLDTNRKHLYQKKCFDNAKINSEGQTLNEKHLIEKQMRKFVPGQLIIFGQLDEQEEQSKIRFAAETSGIVQWKPQTENFIWNNLGKRDFISHRTVLCSTFCMSNVPQITFVCRNFMCAKKTLAKLIHFIAVSTILPFQIKSFVCYQLHRNLNLV